MQRRRQLRKWVLRSVFLGLLTSVYLGLSTLTSLLELWRTYDRYPQVRYPAPSFRPEVSWSDARPKDWVPLETMPFAVWVSVLAAEDAGFYAHDGVEWGQSFAKIRRDLESFKFPHGISTLNQQLAKNLYFGARPAFARKLQELVLARRMDTVMGKDRVLEIYMNVAEWGPGVVGIGQAARHYFKKPVSLLRASECALLANLLPHPRLRGAWVRNGRTPPQLARLVSRTLRRMPATERAVRVQKLGSRRTLAQKSL